MALINARSLSSKTFVLRDFHDSHKPDVMFLTKTWLPEGELTPLLELCPPRVQLPELSSTDGERRGCGNNL